MNNNQNQNFQTSINNFGNDIVDSLAGATKQAIAGASTLLNGAQKTIGNTLNVIDSSIGDIALPTVDKLRTMGIKNGKAVIGIGVDSVKDVGGSIIESGKELVSGIKNIVPKGHANVQVQAPAPTTPEEELKFIEEAEATAKNQLREAHQARQRLNSFNRN